MSKETQFKKGSEKAKESGRKGGIASGVAKRRYTSVKTLTRDMLEFPMPDDPEGKSAGERMLEALLGSALTGDTKAASVLLERGYGRPSQAVDVEHKGTIGVKVYRWAKTPEELEKAKNTIQTDSK